jgi:glyceraldehyde-3-phosphate dehydrogenase (NAD(P))
MKVKVAINGYGTIGKRVTDAVAKQDDMEIIGVTKMRPDYVSKMVSKKYPLYVAIPENMGKFKDAGIDVKGTIDDLLKKVDIVVDGSPGKVGAGHKSTYEKAGVKAIFEGGEAHELAGVSFNAMANYEKAIGKDFVRVVSCNTTGLCRTLYPLYRDIGVDNVKAVLIRRAVDPPDSKKGPINAIEPVLNVPSHHGPDVQTVIPDLNISTMAVKVPTTIMHLHSVVVELKKEVGLEEVLDIWDKTPRIILVSGQDGVTSTAQVVEMARDMGRERNDMYEIVIWKDGVHIIGKTLYYSQAVHQEADVVPENIDCIRAMMEIERDKIKSIEKTNKAMGIE